MVALGSLLSIHYKYLNYILSKIYCIRWEICLPAYPPSDVLCCLFRLKKCCRNLALKQKNITEIFFCLTGTFLGNCCVLRVQIHSWRHILHLFICFCLLLATFFSTFLHMLMAGISMENMGIDRDLFAVFCSNVSWLRCHE